MLQLPSNDELELLPDYELTLNASVEKSLLLLSVAHVVVHFDRFCCMNQ
jgi:hypothetical protein